MKYIKKGKCLYINLNKDRDRRRHIESVINNLSIQSVRISGVEHEISVLGCFLSHKKCIEYIANDKEDYDWYLIFEDDANLNEEYSYEYVIDLLENIEDYLKISPMFLLGGCLNGTKEHGNIPKKNKIYKHLLEGNGSVNCAHAYILKKEYYVELLEIFEKHHKLCDQIIEDIKNKRRDITDIHLCNPDHDYWCSLQKRDRWLIHLDLFYQEYPSQKEKMMKDFFKKNYKYYVKKIKFRLRSWLFPTSI